MFGFEKLCGIAVSPEFTIALIDTSTGKIMKRENCPAQAIAVKSSFFKIQESEGCI